MSDLKLARLHLTDQLLFMEQSLRDYSVNATGDISIEGNEGVTNAKEIQSSEGDIYIKGGVFGGGLTIVEAQGDIFVKHANNCKLYGKEVHVGFIYSERKLSQNLYLSIKIKVKLSVEKLRHFIKLNVHLQVIIMNGRQFFMRKGLIRMYSIRKFKKWRKI